MYYNTKRKGNRSKYIEEEGTPHYPFGYGLSYTSFNYSDLRAEVVESEDSCLVNISVKVRNEGLAEGVKAGGKLVLQMRKLKVKALYNIIPEKLTINVAHLGLGKTVKVGELSFEGLELMNAKEAVVCAVKLTRAARGAAAAAGN